jgi:hypothetical protein
VSLASKLGDPLYRQSLISSKWAHIGRIVYAASNEQLAALTGPGNKENFTMHLRARDVLAGSQKDLEIIGPVEGIDQVVVEESDVYWKTTR